jgi:uncharacterized protein (DUF433 family)
VTTTVAAESASVSRPGYIAQLTLEGRRAAACDMIRWMLVPARMAGQQENFMRRLDRITQQPDMMGGKAFIRGMRVTVGMVVGQIGAGHSIDEILADYPYLKREDITQALRYAAWLAEEREVVLARA